MPHLDGDVRPVGKVYSAQQPLYKPPPCRPLSRPLCKLVMRLCRSVCKPGRQRAAVWAALVAVLVIMTTICYAFTFCHVEVIGPVLHAGHENETET